MSFFFTVGLLRAFNMLIFIGTLVAEGGKVVLFLLFWWQSLLVLARCPTQLFYSPSPLGALVRQVSKPHLVEGGVTWLVS